MKTQWVIPPEKNCEFVAAMEDVLEVYGLPRDPEIPLVCMDEQPVQLLADKLVPLEMKPGRDKREDYEYVRQGTASIFLFAAPLEGWRHVEARRRRTRDDWAEQIDQLLNVHFPNATKIRVVMDNLNTHSLGSLYHAFAPQKALALAKRLEIHHAPKHGSWLNIAEIELAALTKQCLDRRIDSLETLNKEIAAWESARNRAVKNIDWQFSTAIARDKLKRLYPNI